MGNIFTKFARESKQDQNNDVNGETGQNAAGTTNPQTSQPGTSSGFNFHAPVCEVINPMSIQGRTNMINVHPPQTSIVRRGRIEFNVEDSIPSFFGREEFIKKLHDNISHPETEHNEERPVRSQAMVICGPGGVGKTQVVRKYIQKYKKSYDHVLWINAESFTVATSKFLQLARELPIDVTQNGRQKADELIMEEVYDFICQKSALLVFDNVESFKTDDGNGGLHRLLPKSVKTNWKVPAIIITTRNREWKNFKLEELEVFDLNESMLFLSSLEFTDDRDLLPEVVKIFQGLPLALQQVATFIQNKQKAREALNEGVYTLHNFLADFKTKRKEIMKTELEEEYPDLFTLHVLTFEQIGLKKNGELALQCLEVMAILNPDYIPTFLIKIVFSYEEDTLADTLILLHEYNLATRYAGYYQMHRMIEAAKVESNSVNGRKMSYVKQNFEKIIELIKEFLPNFPWNSKNSHEMLHNIVRIHEQGPEIYTVKFLNFKNVLAKKAMDVGSYSTAIQLYRKALQSSMKIYGVGRNETIDCEENLAVALERQGEWAEAEKHLNAVLQLRSKLDGPIQLSTIQTKSSLAQVFHSQGKYAEAQKLNNEVLEIQNNILGADHPDTLNTKSNLASVLFNAGRYVEAREIHNEVLEIRNKILGLDHPDTLATKNNLALGLNKEGKYVEARELYNEVLEFQKKILGPDHPDTLTTKNNLALVLNKEGKYIEARELYNEVLKIRNTILGPDHPDTLTTKNNLALVLNKEGKYIEARELYNEILEIRNKILGPDHPDTLSTKNNLAAVLDTEGKYVEARELYNKVLEILNKILGPDHPNTLSTKNNLALVLCNEGKYVAAREIYNEVLEIRNKILGSDHPDTLNTKHNLASVLCNEGKHVEARELYSEFLEIQNNILGTYHPNTLTTKNNLAFVLCNKGKYIEARELYNEVLEIRNKILGPDHPDTLSTKNNLAAVLDTEGKYVEAREVHNEVLEIRNKILGPDHPDTLATKNNLALGLNKEGKYVEARKLYNEVLEIQNNILGSDHPNTLTTKNNLAFVLCNEGKHVEARELYSKVLEMQNKILGPEHPITLNTKIKLALVLKKSENV